MAYPSSNRPVAVRIKIKNSDDISIVEYVNLEVPSVIELGIVDEEIKPLMDYTKRVIVCYNSSSSPTLTRFAFSNDQHKSLPEYVCCLWRWQ